MEATPSGPNKQEIKFAEGTFGRLVKDFDPLTILGHGGLILDYENPQRAHDYGEVFTIFKNNLLALCSNPRVIISSEQSETINNFLHEIFRFPSPEETKAKGKWIKVNTEKELILATYINSLSK